MNGLGTHFILRKLSRPRHDESPRFTPAGFLVGLLNDWFGHLFARDFCVAVCKIGFDLRHAINPQSLLKKEQADFGKSAQGHRIQSAVIAKRS